LVGVFFVSNTKYLDKNITMLLLLQACDET
jgi:hypothetical protein